MSKIPLDRNGNEIPSALAAGLASLAYYDSPERCWRTLRPVADEVLFHCQHEIGLKEFARFIADFLNSELSLSYSLIQQADNGAYIVCGIKPIDEPDYCNEDDDDFVYEVDDDFDDDDF